MLFPAPLRRISTTTPAKQPQGRHYTHVRRARISSPISTSQFQKSFCSLTLPTQRRASLYSYQTVLLAPQLKTWYPMICKENKSHQEASRVRGPVPGFGRSLTNVLLSDVFRALPTRLTSSFFLTHETTQNTHAHAGLCMACVQCPTAPYGLWVSQMHPCPGLPISITLSQFLSNYIFAI